MVTTASVKDGGAKFDDAVGVDHRGVDRSVIRVTDESVGPAADVPGSHVECLDRQDLGAERRWYVPAQDATGSHVGDERDVRESGPGSGAGDVTHPESSGVGAVNRRRRGR